MGSRNYLRELSPRERAEIDLYERDQIELVKESNGYPESEKLMKEEIRMLIVEFESLIIAVYHNK